MKITLKNKSYIKGVGRLPAGEHDLTEAQIKSLGLEVPKPEKKPRVPKPEAVTDSGE